MTCNFFANLQCTNSDDEAYNIFHAEAPRQILRLRTEKSMVLGDGQVETENHWVELKG